LETGKPTFYKYFKDLEEPKFICQSETGSIVCTITVGNVRTKNYSHKEGSMVITPKLGSVATIKPKLSCPLTASQVPHAQSTHSLLNCRDKSLPIQEKTDMAKNKNTSKNN
jgi:hypothetical protein